MKQLWSFGHPWRGPFYRTRVMAGRLGMYVGLWVWITGFTRIGIPMINEGFGLAVRWPR